MPRIVDVYKCSMLPRTAKMQDGASHFKATFNVLHMKTKSLNEPLQRCIPSRILCGA